MTTSTEMARTGRRICRAIREAADAGFREFGYEAGKSPEMAGGGRRFTGNGLCTTAAEPACPREVVVV